MREKSITMIESNDDLSAHIGMIHRIMDLIDFHRQSYQHETDDEKTVMLLGIRIFNAAGAAIRLSFSGYYQAAGLQLRDMLETGFLLDYFSSDTTLIRRWREVDERKRLREFNLAKIREVLDDRDGFTERKREKHYKDLCVVAGHPTFAGFEMLRPEAGADAHMGPFFVPRLLTATVQELVRVNMVAYESFKWFWKPRTLPQYRAALDYLENAANWASKMYGHDPVDSKKIAAAREIITALERRGV